MTSLLPPPTGPDRVLSTIRRAGPVLTLLDMFLGNHNDLATPSAPATAAEEAAEGQPASLDVAACTAVEAAFLEAALGWIQQQLARPPSAAATDDVDGWFACRVAVDDTDGDSGDAHHLALYDDKGTVLTRGRVRSLAAAFEAELSHLGEGEGKAAEETDEGEVGGAAATSTSLEDVAMAMERVASMALRTCIEVVVSRCGAELGAEKAKELATSSATPVMIWPAEVREEGVEGGGVRRGLLDG